MRTERLLWVVDDVSYSGLGDWDEHFAEFEITRVADLIDAQRVIIAHETDCVLFSGVFRDHTDMELLELAQIANPDIPVAFCQPELSVAEALRLIRAGAYHCSTFAEGPATLAEQIRNAVDEKRRRRRVATRSAASEAWRSTIVGDSKALEDVIDTIRQIGPRRCTVLISGETGTGKEVAARALHLAGPRAAHPFVAVNCSALPENLLEAELFGHVKGAFTGAVNHRMGRFEQANKGTIFLDEIGDMPLEMQAKLLRVLQEKEVQRLGGSETIKVDVRLVAASNLNLLDRVREGKFREDLFYRLNVVPINMPPLRSRVADIPLLVYHFVKKVCHAEGLPLRRITPDAMERLKAHHWPGNVRELENAVEKAVVLSGERDVLTPVDFGMATPSRLRIVPDNLSSSHSIPEGICLDAAVSQFEAGMLLSALKKTGGNKTAAAELLGLKRTTLIMKLRAFESNGRPLVQQALAC